jgi:hypothetical protein
MVKLWQLLRAYFIPTEPCWTDEPLESRHRIGDHNHWRGAFLGWRELNDLAVVQSLAVFCNTNSPLSGYSPSTRPEIAQHQNWRFGPVYRYATNEAFSKRTRLGTNSQPEAEYRSWQAG